MLYLSGDNSLSEDMIRTLNEIDDQGAPDRVAITVQYDSSAAGRPTFRYALAGGNGLPVKEAAQMELAAELEKEIGPFPIAKHLMQTLENEDSADPEVLADFIRWSANTFDSTYRMLILSGHGSGAVGDFLTDQNARRGQPGSLTIPQLRQALELARDGKGQRPHCIKPFPGESLRSDGEDALLHVLGMDSCLMGMAEVCHEVRGHVRYLVGSEGFVPNAGWPYGRLLDELKERCKNKTLKGPEDLAQSIVADVLKHYRSFAPAGVSIDMAACDLRALSQLTTAVGALATTLRTALKRPAVQDLVVMAHWRAQSYKLEQHTDLWDFCHLLQEAAARSGSKEIPVDLAALCNDVTRAIEAVVGKRQGFAGPEFQHSHGLSVYFPWSTADSGSFKPYAKLAFSGKEGSGWFGFLTSYLKETQRDPRGSVEKGSSDSSASPLRFGKSKGTDDRVLVGGGGHKFVERSNKFVERSNKFVERSNKFLMRLLGEEGGTLPWSMKNPAVGLAKRQPVESKPETRPATYPLKHARPARKEGVTPAK
jgi:cysteine peptidase C11 family protein